MRKASSADQMVSLHFELIASTPVRGVKASLKRFEGGSQTILYCATKRSGCPSGFHNAKCRASRIASRFTLTPRTGGFQVLHRETKVRAGISSNL
jgi:hypothetical protein